MKRRRNGSVLVVFHCLCPLALDAVDASGMWTGTFLYTDPRPADRMAFATFSAEPDALTWVFLRNQDGFLRMLAYPCTLASVENSCWPVHDQLPHGLGARANAREQTA